MRLSHVIVASHLNFASFSILRLRLGADLQARRLYVAEVCCGDEIGAEGAANGDRHIAQHHLHDASFFAQPIFFGDGSSGFWVFGVGSGLNVHFRVEVLRLV